MLFSSNIVGLRCYLFLCANVSIITVIIIVDVFVIYIVSRILIPHNFAFALCYNTTIESLNFVKFLLDEAIKCLTRVQCCFTNTYR